MNQLNLKKSLLVLQKDRKNKPEVIQRLKSQRAINFKRWSKSNQVNF